MEQLTPHQLESKGFKLWDCDGVTDFPEFDSLTQKPTGRVYQYYVKGEESYALLISEPSKSVRQ